MAVVVAGKDVTQVAWEWLGMNGRPISCLASHDKSTVGHSFRKVERDGHRQFDRDEVLCSIRLVALSSMTFF